MVSLAQLFAAGLSRRTVERWVQRGWLHRIHRGVYALGHSRLTIRGRWWAAVLATGGVLSHRSAAAAWDLLPTPAGAVDVTVWGQGRSTGGIRVHRSRTLDRVKDVVRDEDGLPCTSVARTMLDLADVVRAHELRRIVERAEQLRILDVRELPGRRKLPVRSVDPDFTRSDLDGEAVHRAGGAPPAAAAAREYDGGGI